MKPFIIITGPQAVGKMAVGMALREKYNYRLFHNHMTIELAKEIFGCFNKQTKETIKEMRETIFNQISKSDLEGFVFTYVWAFNLESEYNYVYDLIEKFESKGWTAFIVELEADVETRLKRNRTSLRLENKVSKRNLEWSDKDLLSSMEKYRLTSNENEINFPRYMRIKNTDLSPDEVALLIKDYIELNELT